jgi:hypothetical protein
MIALAGLTLGLLSGTVLATDADVYRWTPWGRQYTLASYDPGRIPPAFQAPPLEAPYPGPPAYAPEGPNRRLEGYPPPPIGKNTLLPPAPRYGSPGGFMPPPLPYAYERPLAD